jgi:hypothetical protein
MTGLAERVGTVERERVLEMFFGCAESDVADDVILTPIPAFYRASLAGADHVAEHAGWWRLATATRGGHRYSVVQHFEGTRVVDPVLALGTARSRVAFLGLVGAVAPGLDVGDVVRISSAGRAPGAVASWLGPEEPDIGIPVVRALTGNGLLDDPDRVRTEATRLAASVVDLETYFFFEALGAIAPIESLAFGLVTDLPGVEPFWRVQLGDAELAEAGSVMVATILRHWR